MGLGHKKDNAALVRLGYAQGMTIPPNVRYAGLEVWLTRKEFDLLRHLVEHRGEVVTRDRLVDEVWGYEQFPTTRTVDTHILRRLRQKFEKDPERPAWIRRSTPRATSSPAEVCVRGAI